MSPAHWPIGALERALLDSLQRLDPQADRQVLLSAALTCMALEQGDSCLALEHWAGRRPWPELPIQLPELADWQTALQASPLVAKPGGFAPLILDQQRLYLARYHAYETALARQLLARLDERPDVDEQRLQDSLERLFAFNTQRPDQQRRAAEQAVRRRISIISGGPGTGKTTTVVRLLAALLEQPGQQRLAICLAAPTGKAAARLAEAIRQAKQTLPVAEEIRAILPEQAQTLHRLLGSRGDRPTVRHDAANPLPVDVLVVDEASMVDLALLAKVVDALPPTARLILLGDKDQLAAVETGAVFTELCSEQDGRAVLDDALVLLSHSHRFSGDSGIGELARRINAGDVQGVQTLLGEHRPDLLWNARPCQEDLLESLEQGYQPYFQSIRQGDPASAFLAFNRFRALTALREGPWGVSGLNQALELRCRRRLGISARERWYPGRAVMIRHNDYPLGLFNGDIGLCLPTTQGLRVFFETEDGHRAFAPSRVPGHDSAFVMTVHKSQGSEFTQVLLALPEQPSPSLTRNLLYTGITRARQNVEIWALAPRLAEAVQQRSSITAGLALRLQRTDTLDRASRS